MTNKWDKFTSKFISYCRLSIVHLWCTQCFRSQKWHNCLSLGYSRHSTNQIKCNMISIHNFGKAKKWYYGNKKKALRGTSSLAFWSFASLTCFIRRSCWRFIFATPASSSCTLSANHIRDIYCVANHDMTLLHFQQPIIYLHVSAKIHGGLCIYYVTKTFYTI